MAKDLALTRLRDIHGTGRWEGGNAQNRNTAGKKIAKNPNTASKIDGIPKPHSEISSYFFYHKLHLAILFVIALTSISSILGWRSDFK